MALNDPIPPPPLVTISNEQHASHTASNLELSKQSVNSVHVFLLMQVMPPGVKVEPRQQPSSKPASALKVCLYAISIVKGLQPSF